MYRDTDQGVRYLVKRGETRVVSDQMTTSAKAFVLGADIDPSFDRPLPIVADGAMLGATPATFQIVPQSILLKL